jgi:hypothetical protein
MPLLQKNRYKKFIYPSNKVGLFVPSPHSPPLSLRAVPGFPLQSLMRELHTKDKNLEQPNKLTNKISNPIIEKLLFVYLYLI